MSRGGDFWARRKAAVAAEAEAELRAEEQAEIAEAHAEFDEKSDADILSELNLPDPDELDQGDDFSVFLAKAVPERIRRRALRKLWLSNPVLANVDDLVDYGEDFTDSALVVDGLQTAYQVGKGMLKHVEEMARQAEEKALAAADASDLADPSSTAEEEIAFEAEAEEPADTQVLNTEEEAPLPLVAVDEEEMAAPARRRLKFEFAAPDQNEERAAS